MAWIEQRRRRFVVHTRIDGAKVKGPSFPDRADAELFCRLTDLVGWQQAVAYVDQSGTDAEPEHAEGASVRQRAVAAGAVDTLQGLPMTDPGLPAPPGREPSGVSVGELVRRHIDTLTARAGTTGQYRSYVRDHVDTYFGDLDAAFVIRQSHPMAEGTCAKNVVAWRTWLTEKPVLTRAGKPTGRTLSAKTVKNIMCLVSTAFEAAMTDDFAPLVSANPFAGMAPTSTAPDEVERPFLSPMQFQDLYRHTIEHYRDLLLFLVLTGLRWGEAAGMRVRDVCLSPETGRSYIEVRTALKRVKGGTVLGLLKSKAARRRLTLPTVLVPVVAARMRGKGPDDLVFTAPQGGRLHHGNVTRNLDKAVARTRAAGVTMPEISLHTCRHSCAAWLLSAGRTPYQASRQLGHETEATTMKYYGHLVRAEYDANADSLEATLAAHGWDLPSRVDVEVQPTAADADLVVLDLAEVIGDEAEAAAVAA